MPDFKAKLSYARKSARKVRQAADLIRGKNLLEAKRDLKYTPKDSALILMKLLASAEANAKNSGNLKAANLFIKEIKVDEGPTLKRFMPRAFGRAYQIRKRTSHITLLLSEKL